MKIKIRYILLMLLMLIAIQTKAQDTSITLKGPFGDSLQKVAEQYMSKYKDDTGIVGFLYFLRTGKVVECYFGSMTTELELDIFPSYILYTQDKKIILVYTGLEKSILFSQQHQEGILKIAREHFVEEVIRTLHYVPWYCKFKNNKLVKLKTKVPRKYRNNEPFWNYKKYKR